MLEIADTKPQQKGVTRPSSSLCCIHPHTYILTVLAFHMATRDATKRKRATTAAAAANASLQGSAVDNGSGKDEEKAGPEEEEVNGDVPEPVGVGDGDKKKKGRGTSGRGSRGAAGGRGRGRGKGSRGGKTRGGQTCDRDEDLLPARNAQDPNSDTPAPPHSPPPTQSLLDVISPQAPGQPERKKANTSTSGPAHLFRPPLDLDTQQSPQETVVGPPNVTAVSSSGAKFGKLRWLAFSSEYSLTVQPR